METEFYVKDMFGTEGEGFYVLRVSPGRARATEVDGPYQDRGKAESSARKFRMNSKGGSR